MQRIQSFGTLFVIAGALLSGSVEAQTPLPGCRVSLDRLDQKLVADYAGFTLEIRGDRRTAYDAMLADLRTRATAADTLPDLCLGVLQRYIAWFDDPHLFLYQSARLDTAEAARRRAAVVVLPFDSLAFLARMGRSERGRDPIEGVWYDGRLRVAVLPDGDRRQGRFVAVVMTPDTAGWPVGAVRARLERITPGHYRMDLSLPNFARRRLTGDLYRNDLLRTSPGTWGRALPVAALTPGQLDPVDPRRPTLRVHDGTVIVAMPSHDPSYRPVLDSLVAANLEPLHSAKALIIDLRGNEGGSAGSSDALIPYVITDGQAAPPLLDQAAARMLSSPDQIAYAHRAFGPDTSPFVRGLIARMEAAPGALVPLYDPAAPPPDEGLPPAIVGPRRVGVVIDRGTVSAAEVILLYAKQSARVTVYGEPTAGALDYQSTSIVPLAPDEHRWALGYPTITRNDRLPEGGMRGHGIAPDVHLDLARLKDPIAWVERDLARR